MEEIKTYHIQLNYGGWIKSFTVFQNEHKKKLKFTTTHFKSAALPMSEELALWLVKNLNKINIPARKIPYQQ